MNTEPKNILKYCSRCGSNNVKYYSDNSLRCNHCGFKTYINEVSAVACIIVDKEGKILLSKRKNNPNAGKYDLPGGFIDLGEKAEEAVVREIKEELSVDVKTLKYLSSYPNQYIYSDITVYTLDLCFLCTIDSFDNLRANDDVASFHFYKLEDIDMETIAFESVKNILTDKITHKAINHTS